MHHNGKYWKNPSSFNPGRFAAQIRTPHVVKIVTTPQDEGKVDRAEDEETDENQNLIRKRNSIPEASEIPGGNIFLAEAKLLTKIIPASILENSVDKLHEQITVEQPDATFKPTEQTSDEAEKEENDPIKNGCYLPFSRGQRVCIGANFAKVTINT